uniref:AMP-dependent synthetase/ligase domain-containing protein n=1 Tax=Globisporangium ultimum (strain ATCC 200006 / CBS 805.95 / DAOM BR144) TaxID=431595 RepID=K3X768_GLOUD
MLSRHARLVSSLRHALTRPRAHSRPPRCAYASTAAAFEAPSSSVESIIFQSPHASVNVPDGTIWEIAKTQASANGDRNAFICGVTQQNVTFDELYQRAKRLAVALAEDGVRKGDAVILHSFNCVEYPMVVLALMALGAVCSPSSPMFRAPELALQAKSANDLKDVALEAADMVGIQKKRVYTMGEEDAPKLKNVNELSTREYGHFEFEPIDPDSNVLLPFSSGTTGIPKGVALSARNILTNTYQVDHVEKLGDHSLGLLPFFHIYGMMMMHLSIVQGTAKVVLPRFEPESLLKTLSTYKIRTAHIAPPLALFLAHDPLVEKYDLSATEFVVSGGAPVGKELENLVKSRLGMTVKQIYGMTEASPAVNYCEDAFRKPGSVGRLVPNTELRVRCTSTGVDLPANARGELLYRGPQVMLGYLNNPDANNSVFTEDRFLCSGDIGYVDGDGFVFVVDRVKELIKYKGHQVAPAELEDILKHHPAIVDSCCVRGQDSDGQEVPKAYVVLKDKSNAAKITAEEIMEFVADRVAPFKKVRQVEFTDAIPKSPTGKTLRRQLQEIENQKHNA